MSKRRNFTRSHADPSERLRHGCPFTNADLSAFQAASGLSGSDAEKALKRAYSQAEKSGEPVTVSGATVTVTGGKLAL